MRPRSPEGTCLHGHQRAGLSGGITAGKLLGPSLLGTQQRSVALQLWQDSRAAQDGGMLQMLRLAAYMKMMDTVSSLKPSESQGFGACQTATGTQAHKLPCHPEPRFLLTRKSLAPCRAWLLAESLEPCSGELVPKAQHGYWDVSKEQDRPPHQGPCGGTAQGQFLSASKGQVQSCTPPKHPLL
ncbi:hypothetical protein CapIbe_023349 [Capra ibex]